MRLSFEQRGDVHIVRVEEVKLTYPVLATFFAEVSRIVGEGARKLLIDLAPVSYIDSATIGCFMDIHRLVGEHDGAVKLSGLHSRVQTLLSMTGVLRILSTHREEADALAAFGRLPKRNGEAVVRPRLEP
jgi:anti-anti-sigma factor